MIKNYKKILSEKISNPKCTKNLKKGQQILRKKFGCKNSTSNCTKNPKKDTKTNLNATRNTRCVPELVPEPQGILQTGRTKWQKYWFKFFFNLEKYVTLGSVSHSATRFAAQCASDHFSTSTLLCQCQVKKSWHFIF